MEKERTTRGRGARSCLRLWTEVLLRGYQPLIPLVNTWQALTGARLLDFFGSRTPWSRTLWNSGLILTLREILEASEAAQSQVLSENSLTYVVELTKKSARFDLGVGARLGTLQTALIHALKPNSVDFYSIQQQADYIQERYLSNWANAIRTAASPPACERVARAVAAHLLDLGFNGDFLHRWWTYRLRRATPVRTFPDLLDEAHALAVAPPRQYQVLIAFESFRVNALSPRPGGWIDNAAVAAWLGSNKFSTSGVKQNGGLIVTIEARDPFAAAYLAAETIESLSARARIAASGNSEFVRLPQIWVAGEAAPIQIGTRTRPLNVRALIREGVVYQSAGGDEVMNAALEMLGPLHDGSPIAAIAGGWGAIESLLADGERGTAADRLAAIVACSFPRAELTSLSYALEKDDATMATTLGGVTVNRDRAALVAAAIHSNQPLTLSHPSDEAGLRRIRALLANPTQNLGEIQSYMTSAFRRLYRQRNLVLHGGKINAVALRSSLRTAAPLVGAGFDRLAHAHYVNKLGPKALAAHARTALQTITSHKDLATLLP
jgi:hypothetical protein